MCYRIGDYVTVTSSAKVLRIDKIKLFLQLKDGLVWFDAQPHSFLDNDERLLGKLRASSMMYDGDSFCSERGPQGREPG